MSQSSSTAGFSRTVIALHWGMAILIAVVFAAIEFRELFEKGSAPREALKSWHFTLGLIVLALVVVRIVARMMAPPPPITPPPAKWQTFAAQIGHFALYAFMIGMPVLGWLTLSAAGKPIPFALPALIAEHKDMANFLKELHHTLGQIFYIAIGVHVAAALAHHLVFKDNTVARMISWRRA